MKIERAILSVSDKRGIVDFGLALADRGVEIVSTDGTARELREAGIPVVEVGEYTGAGELLDGRVKSLHPRIHAGILARRDRPDDLAALGEAEIAPIDLVVVNLYPFERRFESAGRDLEGSLESIDIGGSTLIRAAAKNYRDVAVVTDPGKYGFLLEEMEATGGRLRASTLRQLAFEAFQLTASYDQTIADAYALSIESECPFRPRYAHGFVKGNDLRYGENPHQRAALYIDETYDGPSIPLAHQDTGKDLSYNNILDLDRALLTISEFPDGACVVIKHGIPAGVALDASPAEAFGRAWAADPLSAFGSIVALNRTIDEETASRIVGDASFIEAILAPSFTESAVEILRTRPRWGRSLRLVSIPGLDGLTPRELAPRAYRGILGGFLVQEIDRSVLPEEGMRLVAGPEPNDATRADLHLAYAVAKHVPSNAIVLVSGGRTVGIGAGQPSRIDSVEIAIRKAGSSVEGSVLASDAFFPFRDSIDRAAEAGIGAIVQPGGSRRDEEVVEAAREHGITMAFTGMRHFRH